MERWKGKVALVTGASTGIGAEVAVKLVEHGLRVVGVARRVEKIEELRKAVKEAPGELFAVKADVSNLAEIANLFKWIKEKFGAIHILVNNAGIARYGYISEGNMKSFSDIIQINLTGLIACTKEALKLMNEAGVKDGHIIHVNSTSGHRIPSTPIPVYNVYNATKFGVRAFTETLRLELAHKGSQIRVSSISPGTVATEIFNGVLEDSQRDNIDVNLKELDLIKYPLLYPEDIANAIIYVISTPKHVQVHDMIVRPVGAKF